MFYSASVANGASFERNRCSSWFSIIKSDDGLFRCRATQGATNIQVNDLDVKIVRNGTTTLPGF
jgi:hypothetical protein